MFPIIPTHMLNGTPSSTSLGKMALNPTSSSYSNAFWNVWTEDFLRRKYISTASSDHCLTNHSIDAMTTTETKTRDSKRIKIEPKPNRGSYAAEAIAKDSKTRSFDCIDLSGTEQEAKSKSFITIDTSSGYIANDQHYSESTWLRSLTLAHDTYSHNAQLEITSDHRLRVKIVKHLVIDEEIQLWFSDEILAILTVPFLTPANILGKNCYKCIDCEKTYENPNPLKIHLATKCDRYTMDDLWSRLNAILPLKSYTLAQPISPFRHHHHHHHHHQPTTTPIQSAENSSKLFQSLDTSDRLRATSIPSFVPSSSPHFVPPITSQCMTTTSLVTPSSFHRQFSLQNLHQLSAFQPIPMSLSPPQIHQFAPHSAHNFHQNAASSTVSHSIPQPSSNAPMNTVVSQGEKVVAAAAAQLETIVSNMGTSKQGHICIYCGKLYSRKYGLKIHIRTHTGFKPLKCKYCLRPFGDPSNLNKHIRLHVQEKSLYKCHVCSKILVRRRDLLRHMNIKHNVTTAEGSTSEGQFSGECESSNDNMTQHSTNGFNETNSSRSNSVCDISSNEDDDDDDYDVRVDVD
ncbi:zinc finger protein Xfin [Sitodiplosis mosellana]|uniref:zinc finger protein Xfin n=1 Tax=Sitodiplosis mosellana TaxID=263140 RepID=UPI002443A4CC|nr:zinc finger protein Xfin [Sitodiplosis mosellana]